LYNKREKSKKVTVEKTEQKNFLKKIEKYIAYILQKNYNKPRGDCNYSLYEKQNRMYWGYYSVLGFTKGEENTMKLRKKAVAVLLSAAMVLTMGNGFSVTKKTVSAATSSTFDNLNQSEITAAMGAGWNLGNQLEAASNGTPGETNWGNPVVMEDLILAVKDAGFKSVRIPVSYLSMIGSDSDYTIQSSWLDRVQQVVDFCIDNDMYAIINMHGDGYTSISGGWLLCGSSEQSKIKAKYKACWKQIAERFKDYDEHLVFESMNEEFDGTYGTPNATAYANINAYNQIFVDTVRQTGGYNDKRWLLVPGWNTNIDYTAGDYGFVVPTDNYLSSDVPSGEKRIMISVHYYDPWDFCGTESGTVTQWGDTVTNSSKAASWGDESYMISQFKKMHDKFVAKGYPVVIGEYGSIDKSNYDSANTANRKEFAYKVCYYANQYGLIPVYWDNGYNGEYGFGLFDRYTYKVTQPEIIQGIMEVYGDTSEATATGISLDKTSLSVGVGEGKSSLTATLSPAGCTDKITWTSSDESIATVNSKGEVTAVSVGTCVITAKTPNGYEATCKVTVPKSSQIKAKLYLLETANWTSVVSDDSVDITANGGTYSLSLTATDSQLKNIGSLYIRDISVGDDEASAFDTATLTVNSFVVNGKTYTLKDNTFTYDINAEASDDGLVNPIFNFSFINVWANTHINDVTVESGNYKAYFNNASYVTSNTVTMNFTVTGINGAEQTTQTTTAPTVVPTKAPTAKPVATAAPTTSPQVTLAPTAKPVVTAAPTTSPQVTLAPTAKPVVTAAPTKAPTAKPVVTAAPTTAPTTKPVATAVPSGSGSEVVLAQNETNKYETNDTSWLMEAADSDIVTLTYTCTEANHGGWGILGWGAAVNSNWVNGTSYNAAANSSEEVTISCTVAELKKSMNITSGSNVSYLCLSTWNGGKIVRLSISSGTKDTTTTVVTTPTTTVEPTTEPTVVPTTVPTVAPTAKPVATAAPTTAKPTTTPQVTLAPTAAPTTSDTTSLTGTFEIRSDWGSGGLGTITIKNTTGKTFTDGWTVEFTVDRDITSMWSGEMTSLGNGRYKVSNPGWSTYLAAGDTIQLDFSVGSGTTTPTISNITLY
jgi:endoglucanase